MDNLVKRKGVCVQIGLHIWAEYLYLTDPNWRKEMLELHEAVHLPIDVTHNIESWDYYGVDADFNSIRYMVETHGTKGTWIPAWITQNQHQYNETQNRMFEDGAWIPDNKGDLKLLRHSVHTPMLSLSDLFRQLNLSNVDLLMVDIDWWEYVIFVDYDWSVYPNCIRIEIHETENGIQQDAHKMRQFFAPHGYEQVGKEWKRTHHLVNRPNPDYESLPNENMEMTFVKRSIV